MESEGLQSGADMATVDGLDGARGIRAEQYPDDAKLSARIQLHQRFSTNRASWQRWLFDHFELSDGARILELGCGRGDLWWENRDRLSPAWRLVLTDLSAGMLASARARLAGVTPRPRFCIADAQMLPFDDASFDVVVANHMLYHVPDRPRAFQEISRVLRPGGRLYAATNGPGHLQELDALIQRHAPEAGAGPGRIDFRLDNGARQLRPWFAEIERADFADGLAITEVEPLVAYILSTQASAFLDSGRVRALRADVAERIAAHGAFRATKRPGLFICQGNDQRD
jgi:SAM-dependent methyltransferase